MAEYLHAQSDIPGSSTKLGRGSKLSASWHGFRSAGESADNIERYTAQLTHARVASSSSIEDHEPDHVEDGHALAAVAAAAAETMRAGKANTPEKNKELCALAGVVQSLLSDGTLQNCPAPARVYTPDGSGKDNDELEDDEFDPTMVLVWDQPFVHVMIMSDMARINNQTFDLEDNANACGLFIATLHAKL